MREYSDLAEHVGVVVTLLGIFAGLSGFLFWRMLVRLERKLDQLYEATQRCRVRLAERFLGREEFRKEKDDLWAALNSHSHSADGRVVR
jgi:hypothetical protein|uniref:Uncharacterized protein n=1 Tax=Desulfobacca acetoxidans TaxID=60893 RepID=A0A7C5AKF2_9BACT